MDDVKTVKHPFGGPLIRDNIEESFWQDMERATSAKESMELDREEFVRGEMDEQGGGET